MDDTEAEIRAELSKLSPADRALAEAQRFCPATDERLGSMGVPKKIMIDGKPVFICCKSCTNELLKEPAKTLEKIEARMKSERPGK